MQFAKYVKIKTGKELDSKEGTYKDPSGAVVCLAPAFRSQHQTVICSMSPAVDFKEVPGKFAELQNNTDLFTQLVQAGMRLNEKKLKMEFPLISFSNSSYDPPELFDIVRQERRESIVRAREEAMRFCSTLDILVNAGVLESTTSDRIKSDLKLIEAAIPSPQKVATRI